MMRISPLLVFCSLILVGSAIAQTPVHITDSLWIDSISTHSGQKAILNINFVNADTLEGLDLPLSYEFPDFQIDSVSFVGSRLFGKISTIVVITSDSALLHIGALILNPNDQDILPGRGLLARIYLTVPNAYPAREIDLDTTFIHTSLTFVPTRYRQSYAPVFRKGIIINSFAPATQDSLWVANQQIHAGLPFMVSINAFDQYSITNARIPVRYHSDNLVLDSVSTAGTRSANATLVQYDNDPVAHEVLISLNFTEDSPLASGTGPLVNLYFTCLLGGTTAATFIDTTIISGVPLNFRLANVFNNVQIYPSFRPGKLTISTASDAHDDHSAVPLAFALKQNEPNPFNPTTTISFALPDKAQVKLIVYNVLGQHVRTLMDQHLPAGQHEVIFDGRDDSGHELATGIYLYRISTDKNTQTKKMALIK
jgi:hypothetical protein